MILGDQIPSVHFFFSPFGFSENREVRQVLGINKYKVARKVAGNQWFWREFPRKSIFSQVPFSRFKTVNSKFKYVLRQALAGLKCCQVRILTLRARLNPDDSIFLPCGPRMTPPTPHFTLRASFERAVSPWSPGGLYNEYEKQTYKIKMMIFKIKWRHFEELG